MSNKAYSRYGPSAGIPKEPFYGRMTLGQRPILSGFVTLTAGALIAFVVPALLRDRKLRDQPRATELQHRRDARKKELSAADSKWREANAAAAAAPGKEHDKAEAEAEH